MSDRKATSITMLLGIALIMLPLLYFLSYGPMTLLYDNTPANPFDAVYEVVYQPLDWLYDETPCDVIIDAYMWLWE